MWEAGVDWDVGETVCNEVGSRKDRSLWISTACQTLSKAFSKSNRIRQEGWEVLKWSWLYWVDGGVGHWCWNLDGNQLGEEVWGCNGLNEDAIVGRGFFLKFYRVQRLVGLDDRKRWSEEVVLGRIMNIYKVFLRPVLTYGYNG